MLTRNGIQTLMCMGTYPEVSPAASRGITIIAPTGGTITETSLNFSSGPNYISSYNLSGYTVLDDQQFTTTGAAKKFGTGQCCLLIGTGTTTPTIDDYKLESCITSGYTRGYMSCQMDVNNYIRTFTLTITASEDLTINEIGLYYELGTDSSERNYQCLVARKVLSTPITVEAGKTASIQYTLDFKNINAD